MTRSQTSGKSTINLPRRLFRVQVLTQPPPHRSSYVDVRDLALAHVLALQKPEAGGERIIVSAGPYKWQDWGKHPLAPLHGQSISQPKLLTHPLGRQYPPRTAWSPSSPQATRRTTRPRPCTCSSTRPRRSGASWACRSGRSSRRRRTPWTTLRREAGCDLVRSSQLSRCREARRDRNSCTLYEVFSIPRRDEHAPSNSSAYAQHDRSHAHPSEPPPPQSRSRFAKPYRHEAIFVLCSKLS